MIYLDSSVALAYLLAEDRYPPKALWHQPIVSSRLLECEVWNRINARRLQDSHGDAVRGLIGRIAIIEMVPPVLRRAPSSRFPFPFPFARWMPFTWRPSSSSVPKEQACSFPATTNGWSGLHVCSELPSGTEFEYFYYGEGYDRSMTSAFRKPLTSSSSTTTPWRSIGSRHHWPTPGCGDTALRARCCSDGDGCFNPRPRRPRARKKRAKTMGATETNIGLSVGNHPTDLPAASCDSARVALLSIGN